MMGNLADLELEDLLEKAKQVGVLDRWEVKEDALVFESSTMSIAIDEQKAKPFVRGLLRGYELALSLQDESQSEADPT